jgi:hypothetical protein
MGDTERVHEVDGGRDLVDQRARSCFRDNELAFEQIIK